MARRPPAILYTSFENTYLEFDAWHVSRYDFADESAPIWLCNMREGKATPLYHTELHMLQRFIWAMLELTDDDVAVMDDTASEFLATCERLQVEYHGDDAAEESEREAIWQREHEAGLRDQWRYL